MKNTQHKRSEPATHTAHNEVPRSRPRLVPRGNDKTRIVRSGKEKVGFSDLYVQLLDARWRTLAALIAVFYLSANVFFACMYMALGHGIENARDGSFEDAFFFSVQTMATIGYGKLIPVGVYANILVTLEALFGFGFFAVVTGLVFAKFSRPTARVIFSNVAVICPYEGKPHLMIRLVNERNNRIVESAIRLVLLRKETSKEGHQMRRFHDLQPVRSRVPFLQLSWTIMHPIDEKSPLYQMTPEKLAEWEAEIVVTLTGMDETLAQTVHARHSYIDEEIECNAMFEDVLHRGEDGSMEVKYDMIHKTRNLPGATA